MFNDFIYRSLSAIIQGVTPIFKDVNHINPADNMPAMVVYILFSEIVISCEYIPLVDIIPIISHRRQCLEQLDILTAVVTRIATLGIFGLKLTDAVSGLLVIVAYPVYLVSDFKPINPSAMQSVPAVEQRAGEPHIVECADRSFPHPLLCLLLGKLDTLNHSALHHGRCCITAIANGVFFNKLFCFFAFHG